MSAFPFSTPTMPATQNPYASAFGQSGTVPAFAADKFLGMNQTYQPNNPFGLGGYMFGVNPAIGPTTQQMYGGLMADWASQNLAQQQNFEQNRRAADMFLQQSQGAAQNIMTPVNDMFQQAMDYQAKGAQEAAANQAALMQQMQAAQAKAEASKAEVGGIFDQAYGQIGEGVNRVASSAAAAIEKRKQADVDAFLSENMGAFPGTESQIQEATRRSGSEYDRTLFDTVSNLQYGAEKDKAAVLQGKAQTFANLGSTIANMGMQSAQLGYAAAQDKNQWNQLGSQLAMGHAQLYADLAQNYAALTQANYLNYAKLVKDNPVTGLLFTPTLIQMSQLSGGAEAAPSFGRM